MTISMHDTGVADLIFVYSARECLLRQLPELAPGVAIAADRPRLAVTSSMGTATLEKGHAGWAVTSPSDPSVRLVNNPSFAAAALADLIRTGSHHPTAA